MGGLSKPRCQNKRYLFTGHEGGGWNLHQFDLATDTGRKISTPTTVNKMAVDKFLTPTERGTFDGMILPLSPGSRSILYAEMGSEILHHHS